MAHIYVNDPVGHYATMLVFDDGIYVPPNPPTDLTIYTEVDIPATEAVHYVLNTMAVISQPEEGIYESLDHLALPSRRRWWRRLLACFRP